MFKILSSLYFLFCRHQGKCFPSSSGEVFHLSPFSAGFQHFCWFKMVRAHIGRKDQEEDFDHCLNITQEGWFEITLSVCSRASVLVVLTARDVLSTLTQCEWLSVSDSLGLCSFVIFEDLPSPHYLKLIHLLWCSLFLFSVFFFFSPMAFIYLTYYIFYLLFVWGNIRQSHHKSCSTKLVVMYQDGKAEAQRNRKSIPFDSVLRM